jgi:hypothetical protein
MLKPWMRKGTNIYLKMINAVMLTISILNKNFGFKSGSKNFRSLFLTIFSGAFHPDSGIRFDMDAECADLVFHGRIFSGYKCLLGKRHVAGRFGKNYSRRSGSVNISGNKD